MPTDIVIAKIKKSSTSEVWVVAKEFAGARFATFASIFTRQTARTGFLRKKVCQFLPTISLKPWMRQMN